jgi:hypothetical protein
VSDIVIDPTNPASLLDYAEVNFYLADAAERSISGTPAAAAGFYNKVSQLHSTIGDFLMLKLRLLT